MRVATYVALVIRRIWARKMMLIGSFLGATLVSALLVVLPLYESSVQAIDLLYTFRQAPASTVDLRAAHSAPRFTAEQADANRQVIDSAVASLRDWYPTTDERIVSGDFVLIPLDVPDWLGLAEEWRDAGGHTAGAPPYPTPPQEPHSTRFFTSPTLDEIIDVFEGALVDEPNPQQAADPVLRVVFGEDLARAAGLQVGDRTVLKGFVGGPAEFEMVEVAGIARPVDPGDPIWDQAFPTQSVGRLVFVPEGTFDAWTGVTDEAGAWRGAFVADPSADPWLRGERGFRASVNHVFFMPLDRDAVGLDNVERLTSAITGFNASLARSDIRSLSALPGLVAEFDVRAVVFGAPILAMLALVVAGALYFLIYMAALAIEREGNEMALMRMRGASPWQTTGLHLIQSLIIAAAAMLVAPMVARLLVSFTGYIPPMSTLTGGEALAVSLGAGVIPFVVAGGALTFLSMGLAILPVARRSVLELRALATRPATKSVWQRYHLDLFLVVLAAVVLWELRQRGIVDTGRDELGLDPFSIAAPALFLVSGALLLLRVLPWILRGAGWLMTRMKGMTTALPGWHLGRNPIPYGRLALLVWLTTGFGAFALTYAATLERSYADRAAFASGADIRLVGEGVGYLEPPEEAVASPVYRGLASPRLASRGSELLAVEPETFAAVVAWREDFGAETPGAAFGPEVLGPPVDWGIALPEGTTTITVDGVLVPEPWAVRAETGAATPVRLLVRVADDRGRFRVHVADTGFVDDRWQTVTVDLSGDTARGGPLPDADRLWIQALWVERDAGTGAVLEPGEVLVTGWEAVGPAGAVPLDTAITDTFDAHGGLQTRMVAASAPADRYFSALPEGVDPDPGAAAASPLRRTGEAMAWTLPARNRGQPVPHMRAEPQPINVVIDRTVAFTAGLGIGSETSFGFEGVLAPGIVTGIVDLVPTTGDDRYQGVVVSRFDAIKHWTNPDPGWSLTGVLGRSLQPTELWVSAADVDGVLRSLLIQYDTEPDAVLTIAGASADFSSRPIQVGLVAILFIGTGAGVVLALAGVTGYVLVAVRRRYREMGVLRALGFRQRGVAGTFALEQLVVLGVGAVVGVGAGIGLMRLMIPFLQLGEGAREIVPAATMEFAADRLWVYLAVVTGLLVISVIASTRSVSARRLSEVLREVER